MNFKEANTRLYYEVASVAANNAPFFVYDRQFLKGDDINTISLQVTSVGGGATISWQSSEDGVTWVSVNAYQKAGGSPATSTNAVSQWVIPVMGRYTRVLTTAYTSGTISIAASGFLYNYEPSNNSQSVSLVTGSSMVADVGLQVRTSTTGAPSRRHLVSAATTNATNVKASAGKITGYRISNTTAAWKYLKLHNSASAPTAGTGVVETIGCPPNSTTQGEFLYGIAFSTGIGFTTTNLAADADATAVAANDLIIDLYYA